ncbi:MAG: NADH-quinone oxidoreductase subunit NuoB [Candidatus Moraniibacteriota bacterium]
MYGIVRKIALTPKTVIPLEELTSGVVEVKGKKLEEKIARIFDGSLSIRVVSAGSSNAEEQELVALSNGYYDIERFGIRFTASPRHADMLMVTGPVSHNMAEAVRRTFDAMPTPKIVVAVGDGAIHGGVFRDSYAIHNSLSEVIPVDFEIPGDPPSPKQIISALFHILEDIEEEL